MANTNTAIQWTDATWNPVTGCDRVSEGCTHCYAADLAARLKAMGNPRYQNDGQPPTSGPGFGVTLHPDVLEIPLRWRKPRRVFVNSMSDLFHADVPTAFVADVFAVMALAHWHTFQVLTKRPRRMHRLLNDQAFRALIVRAFERFAKERRLPNPGAVPWPLPSVWLGVSVENQEAAYRIDWLIKTPAAVRFLSCEPLLGPLDLGTWLWSDDPCTSGLDDGCPDTTRDLVHWVIGGGESGPRHRPCDPAWAQALRDQCLDASVPFFWKQWGGRTPRAGGRLLDGREWNEFPEVAAFRGGR